MLSSSIDDFISIVHVKKVSQRMTTQLPLVLNRGGSSEQFRFLPIPPDCTPSASEVGQQVPCILS